MSDQNPGMMQFEPPRRVGAPDAPPKDTVTIGDTTLRVNSIRAWRYTAGGDGHQGTTSVFLDDDLGFRVEGDHRAALDAAVNDPRRWLSSSLAQAVE